MFVRLRMFCGTLGAGLGPMLFNFAQIGAQTVRPGQIRGTITDSVHHQPLAAAVVSAMRLDVVPETTFIDTTDSKGRFRFERLAPGRYAVTFASAFLDSIEFGGPMPGTTVRSGQTARVDLAIPSGSSLRALACPGATFLAHTGVLQGILIDAETERRLAGAEILVAWSALADADAGVRKAALVEDPATARVVRVTTDSGGHYKFCGVPTDAWIVVEVHRNGRVGAPLRVSIDDAAGVAVRNLSFSSTSAHSLLESSDSLPSGRASLVGTVRDGNGQGLDGAEVSLLGSDAQARTNERGEFSLGGLPAGTSELEVRRIGYGVVREQVDLRSEQTLRHDIRLERVINLDSMLTLAARSKYPEFEKRRRIAVDGRFVDEAEIDQFYRGKVNAVSDVIERLAPMSISGTAHVLGQGSSARIPGCRVFVDGAPTPEVGDRLNGNYEGTKGDAINEISMEDVGAIEIYRDAKSAPLPFLIRPSTPSSSLPQAPGMLTPCVILIWSKRT